MSVSSPFSRYEIHRESLGWLERQFLPAHDYGDRLTIQRANILLRASILFIFLGPASLIWLELRGETPVGTFLLGIPLAVLFSVCAWLVHTGRLEVAGTLFITALLINGLVRFVLARSILNQSAILALALPIVFSPIRGRRAPYIVLAIAMVTLSAIIGWRSLPMTVTAQRFLYLDTVTILFELLLVTVFTGAVNNILFSTSREALKSVRQLEAAAVVTETSSTTASLSELLESVVERIRDAYGFYHAQVFLIDRERRLARLEASTGRAGEALLARGHALAVGSQSVVGQCTATGQPVVVNDVTRSATHRPNPLLPDTRAELSLPLTIGKEIIGAIDVQSVEPNVFQPEDIRSLQVMAAQLANVVEKTRLLDQLQARAVENEQLLRDAQFNLRQIEELNRRLTSEGWTEYMRARRARGTLGYTLRGGIINSDSSWTAPMKQAYQSENSVVIRQDHNAHIAAIPMRLRGETIGVLEIERNGDRPWSDQEIEMAELLVDRLVVAVENARLYEQSTQAAQRERFVNQVAKEVQEAQSIEEVLRAALSELSNALGASRGVVQIAPRVVTDPSPSGASEAPAIGS